MSKFIINLLGATIAFLLGNLLWLQVQKTDAWTVEMWVDAVVAGLALVIMCWLVFRTWQDYHRKTAVFIGVTAIIVYGVHYGLRLTENYTFNRDVSFFAISLFLCMLIVPIVVLNVVRSEISNWAIVIVGVVLAALIYVATPSDVIDCTLPLHGELHFPQADCPSWYRRLWR